MDTISLDVLQYLLDFVETGDDLVQFRRMSKVSTQVVDDNYWRHRISKLLELSITMVPYLVNWSQVYQKLVTRPATEWFPIILEYLPAPTVLEWIDIHQPTIDLNLVVTLSRFDLIVDLVRLEYSRDTSSFGRLEGIYLLLLANHQCPLEVLVELNHTYQFIQRAAQPIKLKVHLGYRKLKPYIEAAESIHDLSRIVYIVDSIPFLSFQGSYAWITRTAVKRIDSPLLLLYLLSKSTPDNRRKTEETIYMLRSALGERLGSIVITTMTPQQVREDVQEYVRTPSRPSSGGFYYCLLQHPAVSRDVLITQIMPKFEHWVRQEAGRFARDRKRMDIHQGVYHTEYWGTLPVWAEWGITDFTIFLDPRTVVYVAPFYDTLHLLTLVPYSNDPNSQYFQLLLRLPNVNDTHRKMILTHYIRDTQPLLATDEVLRQNLTAVGRDILGNLVILPSTTQ
jgi:hypothetical protein